MPWVGFATKCTGCRSPNKVDKVPETLGIVEVDGVAWTVCDILGTHLESECSPWHRCCFECHQGCMQRRRVGLGLCSSPCFSGGH